MIYYRSFVFVIIHLISYILGFCRPSLALKQSAKLRRLTLILKFYLKKVLIVYFLDIEKQSRWPACLDM